jgi:hypothetical protein
MSFIGRGIYFEIGIERKYTILGECKILYICLGEEINGNRMQHIWSVTII